MPVKFWKNKGEKQRDKFVDDVKDFCASKKRKGYLVIVADPETNAVVAGYNEMISGIYNKDKTHTIKEMFKFEPHLRVEKVEGQEEPQLMMQDEPIDSERNKAIKQFLFEIDGIIDSFGKKIYSIREGEKELKSLAKQKKAIFGSSKGDLDVTKGLKKIDLAKEVEKVQKANNLK